MGTEGNVHVEADSDTQTISGVDTDGDGQFTVSFSGVRNVASLADVNAVATGGYVVNQVSTSGNSVTFELLYGGGAGAELDLVTNGAGVTDVHASVNS